MAVNRAVGVMGPGTVTTVARHTVLGCQSGFGVPSEALRIDAKDAIIVVADFGDDMASPDFRYIVLCADGRVGFLYHDELSL